MTDKIFSPQQVEIQEALKWCASEDNYIGLSPLDLWDGQLCGRDQKIEKLESENARLRAALGFYADPIMYPDGGGVAREALEHKHD